MWTSSGFGLQTPSNCFGFWSGSSWNRTSPSASHRAWGNPGQAVAFHDPHDAHVVLDMLTSLTVAMHSHFPWISWRSSTEHALPSAAGGGTDITARRRSTTATTTNGRAFAMAHVEKHGRKRFEGRANPRPIFYATERRRPPVLAHARPYNARCSTDVRRFKAAPARSTQGGPPRPAQLAAAPVRFRLEREDDLTSPDGTATARKRKSARWTPPAGR